MFTRFEVSDTLKFDENFSVIELLTDAIRIEDDVGIGQQDKEAIVQDLYEGPRKCQCCINWMTECPNDVDLTELNKTNDEDVDANLLAIMEEQDAAVKKLLIILRGIVKRELADAFAVSKEVVAYGLIIFNYL
ncbi:aaa family [Colletotrichum incanum]|uniref:Aaa family n=1 Tax=Colletotrichum incanum TaxID=1573173 RepID=A0A166LIC7_COLIC|nr:aaa family [Colletotrichum incanum]